MLDDCSRIVPEVKYNTKCGEGVNILTTEQMPQRLSIVLAQVKAGNTSENLLNETNYIFSVFSKKDKNENKIKQNGYYIYEP